MQSGFSQTSLPLFGAFVIRVSALHCGGSPQRQRGLLAVQRRRGHSQSDPARQDSAGSKALSLHRLLGRLCRQRGKCRHANYFSLARILEATLYPDPEQEKEAQISFERIDRCTTFEEVRDTIYRNILHLLRSVLNDYTKYGALYSRISPHPTYSACLEGCLASRKDESEGGSKYKQRVIVLAFSGESD